MSSTATRRARRAPRSPRSRPVRDSPAFGRAGLAAIVATVNDHPTTIVVPPSAYGAGYAVVVEGGTVLSEPCAPTLAVAHADAAATVNVRAVPGTACAR